MFIYKKFLIFYNFVLSLYLFYCFKIIIIIYLKYKYNTLLNIKYVIDIIFILITVVNCLRNINNYLVYYNMYMFGLIFLLFKI